MLSYYYAAFKNQNWSLDLLFIDANNTKFVLTNTYSGKRT